MTISDDFIGTQNTNEMEICLPNHIFDIDSILECNEAFVLSISTRNPLRCIYAYKSQNYTKNFIYREMNYRFALMLDTVIEHLRLLQSRVLDRRY